MVTEARTAPAVGVYLLFQEQDVEYKRDGAAIKYLVLRSDN